MNGQPYIKQTQNGQVFFVKLTVVGNICYFIMPALQQALGIIHPQEKIMKLETGEICDFSYSNLLRLTADDPEFSGWLRDLIYPERKLYKYMLIYNKRNQVVFNSEVA